MTTHDPWLKSPDPRNLTYQDFIISNDIISYNFVWFVFSIAMLENVSPEAQNIAEGLRAPSKNESFKNNILLDHGVAIRQKWRENVFL